MGYRREPLRALLGLVLVCTAIASDAGKEYRYSYTGQMRYIPSAMPTQTSGMSFKSTVRVQKLDDRTCAMKIENLEMATFNKRDPEIWKNQDAMEFTKNEQMSAMVERPFILHYDFKDVDGSPVYTFDHMEVHASDPTWSINIKKGLASVVNIMMPPNDSEHTYKARQTTIHGDCNVQWNIQHHRHWSNPDAKVFNMTKFIDFNDCTRIPYKMYGSLKGSPCRDCEETATHPLQTTAKARYSFVSPTGDRKDLILEKAAAYSQVIHAPYTENGNVLRLLSIQHMTHLETIDATEKLEISGDKEVQQHLNMVFEKDSRFNRPVDMRKHYEWVDEWDFKGSEEATIKLMKALGDLKMPEGEESQVGLFKKKDPTTWLNDLMQSLGMLDYAGTEKVFDAVVKSAPEDKKLRMQKLFVEVTAATGHNPGLQLLVDKISSGEIDTRFIDSFLSGIKDGLEEVSEKSLNVILDFCNSDIMKNFKQEKMQCMLTYTAMVDEACRLGADYPPLTTAECKNGTLQMQVFDKLVPPYKTAKKDSPQDMKMFIHVAGNLKTAKGVMFLKEMINDKETEHFERLDAIRGLIMILPKHAKMIENIAIEIYTNPSQPSDLRMMAAVVIFKGQPSLSLLQVIAGNLPYEKSDQVRSFVVSMIKEIDNSNMPCFKALAQHIRYVAPMIAQKMPSEWKRKDHLTSHMKLRSGYDPKYDLGGHMLLSVIMGDSFLPREFYFGMGDYSANFYFDTFGLTLRQQGMEKIVDFNHSPRKFGTTLGRNLWSLAGKRRLARDAASVKQEMDQIDSTLNIKTKKYDPMRLELTLSAFGHDETVFSFNESHFAPLMSPHYKPGTLLNNFLSTDTEENTMMNLHDLFFEVPTGFGLIACISVQMPTVISYRRKGSSFEFNEKGTLKLKLNRHIMVDTSLEEKFGIGIPGFKKYLGGGFSRRFGVNWPLNVDVDADFTTGKITFNKDFKLPRDLLSWKFRPFTFVHDFSADLKIDELELFHDNELVKTENEEVMNILGVQLKRSVTSLPHDVVRKEREDWMYKKNFMEKLQYIFHNPKWHPHEMHLTAEQADVVPVTGRVLTLKHKMTPPEATERPKSAFKEFQEDLPDSFVHVVNVVDEMKGEKERRLELELRYSYLPQRTDHWVQMFYERTPYLAQEKDRTKICMSAKMKQTTTDWTKLTKEDVQHINDKQNVTAQIALRYGKDCTSGAEINADISYEHSEQQKQWLKELGTGKTATLVPELENPYTANYNRCVEWLAKGMGMPRACHKFIIHSSQLNLMRLTVKYNDKVKMSPVVSTVVAGMISKRYPHLQYFDKRNSTERKVKMESIVREPCIDQRVADITMVGPSGSGMWRNVPVSWGAHWAPKTATHLGMTNMQSYSRQWYHRYCDHQLDSMKTFDGEIYPIPPTKCWKVLAEDCSEQKLFTLLTKGQGSDQKDIKLLMDTHSVEIKKVADKLMLVMDGTEEEMEVGKPKIVKNEHGVVEMILMNKGDIWMVDSPVYGLYIIGHTSSVFVQVAPFYRGKICGLCGNFNFDRQHEFHTTDGCHHHTPWSFARNFVLPDSQCEVPEADKTGAPFCHVPHKH